MCVLYYSPSCIKNVHLIIFIIFTLLLQNKGHKHNQINLSLTSILLQHTLHYSVHHNYFAQLYCKDQSEKQNKYCAFYLYTVDSQKFQEVFTALIFVWSNN